MKVSDLNYRLFTYEIHLATGDGWGGYENTFYTKSTHPFRSDHYKTFEECKASYESQIDLFYDQRPNTMKDLLNGLEKCLVWSGYEDCNFDKKTAEILISSYIKGLKG